jgi:hypothetical protein
MIRFVYEGLPRYWGWVVGRLKAAARAAGLLSWLERRRNRPAFFYLRALFAYYDIEDMAYLDVPFWVFKAAYRVDAFLADREGKATVFEYGAGASSLWLAKRAARVVSVDHDEAWAAVVRRLAVGMPHLSLTVLPPGERQTDGPYRSGDPLMRGRSFEGYVRSIENAGGPFDLIAIDGRARADCLRTALPYLKDDGLIVLDNAYRPRYRKAIRDSGLRLLRFRGAVPGLPFPEETMLLSRDAAAHWLVDR